MFTKIAKIKNIGSFKDFNNNINLAKNNIFYALNGHGKTTLTSIINSIKNNDFSSLKGRKTLGETGDIECIINSGSICYKIENNKWKKNGTDLTETDKDIVIFDDNYINENIYSETFERSNGRNLHKIIFGDDGIKLNNELNALQLTNKTEKSELVILKGKFNNILPYRLNDYIKIDILKLDEDKLKERKKIIENDIKNITKQAQIKSKNNFTKLDNFDYILDNIKTIFTTSKVSGEAHKKAKEKVEEFKNEYFNEKSNIDFFIKYGLENIKNNKCSFCHQDLSEQVDLLEIYKNYFDIEYEKLLKELNKYYEIYKNYNFELDIKNLSDVYIKNEELYNYWKEKVKLIDLYDLKDLGDLIINIKGIHKKIIIDLNNKLKDLNSDFVNTNINIIIDNINKSNVLINNYNLIINDNIILIDNFKKGLDSSKLSDLEKEKNDIKVKLLRLDINEIKKVEEYIKKEKSIIINKGLIDKKRKELNNYTKTIINDYEKLINDKLKDLGIRNFEVGNINDTTHVNGSYVEIVIKINGKEINLKDDDYEKPGFKNTLSRGDKNTLAFAFFLAYIEKKENKENLILIFDDPLSSHDENRQRQTVNQIRLLSNSVKQTIILTHKRDFLTILNNIFKKESNYFHLIKSRALNNSSILALDIGKFLSSEFEKTIEKLEKYLIDTTSSSIGSIQNDLRKIFEDIFRIKYYRILRSNKYLTLFTYDAMNDNFFKKGILVEEKTKLIELSSYVNDGSHFTETSGNEEELCGYIEKSLELIEKI